MQESDGDDGEGAIGDGAVLIYSCENHDAADEEDQDEFEERHLGSGAAAQHADDEQKNEVADDRANDGVHD